jgi:hypothetical protein
MKSSPHFKQIRFQIINTLKRVRKSISVAVCWFTNDDLFSLLCSKLDEGVSVELIILDDYINANPLGCNFQIFINKGGHLYLGSVENPMYNKYCIVDSEILILSDFENH